MVSDDSHEYCHSFHSSTCIHPPTPGPCVLCHTAMPTDRPTGRPPPQSARATRTRGSTGQAA
jgi:hypothetical protein